MEGIVRAAFGKYITTKLCDDCSDAVHMLFEEVSVEVGVVEFSKR